MAISMLVSVTDHASPMLTALEGAMTPRALAANVGEAEVVLFQKHFANAPSNQSGYPSTGFWKDAARATNWQPAGDNVVISVNQIGVRQRLMGGDIFPVKGNYLAIPARSEAYGKAPSEFDNLQMAWHRVGGRPSAFALVEAAASQLSFGRKKKNGGRDYSVTNVGGGVYFWLVKSVHQVPDPTVIPDPRDIIGVARDTMASIVERISKQRGAV